MGPKEGPWTPPVQGFAPRRSPHALRAHIFKLKNSQSGEQYCSGMRRDGPGHRLPQFDPSVAGKYSVAGTGVVTVQHTNSPE